MRVDRAPGSAIRFDNMMTRKANGALKGTNGWTERSIVLEVPDEATSIHYGFFLQGYGRVWAKSFDWRSRSSTHQANGKPRRAQADEPRFLADRITPPRPMAAWGQLAQSVPASAR
jgi:hypothetical protein